MWCGPGTLDIFLARLQRYWGGRLAKDGQTGPRAESSGRGCPRRLPDDKAALQLRRHMGAGADPPIPAGLGAVHIRALPGAAQAWRLAVPFDNRLPGQPGRVASEERLWRCPEAIPPVDHRERTAWRPPPVPLPPR